MMVLAMASNEPITVRIGRTSTWGDKLHIIDPTNERSVCHWTHAPLTEKQRSRIRRVTLDALLFEDHLCSRCWKRYEQLVGVRTPGMSKGKKSA